MAPNEKPSADTVARMYEVMKTIAVADKRFRDDVQSGQMQAAFYPVHGLEGVCAAMGAVLERGDRVISTYRNLGDALATGLDLRAVVAECAGRATGASKGKGGPMHIQDLDAGLVMTTGVVGSGLPIATGVALGAQLDGAGRVVFVTFGDGATSIGAYHEAMNLASLWKLPLVFICQNNGWAEHTPLDEFAPVTDLAERAKAYGLTAVAVDGFDALATWAVFRDAVARARSGGGPTFVECRTYRLTGHVGTGDYSYMPEDVVAAATQRDPVPAFRGLLPDAQADEIDERAAQTVEEAFTFAYESPPPDPGELYRDVFADESLVPRS